MSNKSLGQEHRPLPGADVMVPALTVKPLPDDEIGRYLQAMKDAEQLRQEMRARRGGKSLAPSWPILRAIRERDR
jgi:hypothetical protein